MSKKTYGKKPWLCKPCNWFIYPGALEWQEKLGLQEWPWTCPECKGTLVQED